MEKKKQIEEEIKFEYKIKQEIVEKNKKEELEKQMELMPKKSKSNNLDLNVYNQKKNNFKCK